MDSKHEQKKEKKNQKYFKSFLKWTKEEKNKGLVSGIDEKLMGAVKKLADTGDWNSVAATKIRKSSIQTLWTAMRTFNDSKDRPFTLGLYVNKKKNLRAFKDSRLTPIEDHYRDLATPIKSYSGRGREAKRSAIVDDVPEYKTPKQEEKSSVANASIAEEKARGSENIVTQKVVSESLPSSTPPSSIRGRHSPHSPEWVKTLNGWVKTPATRRKLFPSPREIKRVQDEASKRAAASVDNKRSILNMSGSYYDKSRSWSDEEERLYDTYGTPDDRALRAKSIGMYGTHVPDTEMTKRSIDTEMTRLYGLLTHRSPTGYTQTGGTGDARTGGTGDAQTGQTGAGDAQTGVSAQTVTAETQTDADFALPDGTVSATAASDAKKIRDYLGEVGTHIFRPLYLSAFKDALKLSQYSQPQYEEYEDAELAKFQYVPDGGDIHNERGQNPIFNNNKAEELIRYKGKLYTSLDTHEGVGTNHSFHRRSVRPMKRKRPDTHIDQPMLESTPAPGELIPMDTGPFMDVRDTAIKRPTHSEVYYNPRDVIFEIRHPKAMPRFNRSSAKLRHLSRIYKTV